jgi:copper transport protein
MTCTALWLLGSVLTASSAQAHAELVSATPADGAHLDKLPQQATLTFSEAVAIRDCAVVVNDESVPLHQPAGKPSVVIADLTGVKPSSGLLYLDWRSVSSDDGHTATGTITLHVASGPADGTSTIAAAAPAPAIAGPDDTVRHVLIADELLGFCCLAAFVGGLGFLALIWPEGGHERRTRRLLSAAWLVGTLAAALEIPLRAGYAALLHLGGIFDGAAIESLLGTHLGATLLARTLLWLLGGIVLAAVLQQGERAARSPGWRIGLVAVAFGLLRTTGMPAHDDTAHPLSGAVADTAHLAGASLWIGGLAVLLIGVLPRRSPEELAAIVPRFSKLALASVSTILFAGLVLAWQLLGSVHALLHTSYGHLLLVKLGVVGAVLLLAQHSKSWVRHRLDIAVLLRGDRATVRPFVYSVAAETGLALAVLTAASVLVTSSPGR